MRATRGNRRPRSGALSKDQPLAACPALVCPSASVVAVDGDIFLGQVAGPDRGLAAPNADIGADTDVLALHVGGRRCFGIAWVAFTLEGKAIVAEPDRQPVAVGRLA